MSCGSNINECLSCKRKKCIYDRPDKGNVMEKKITEAKTDTKIKKRIDNYVNVVYRAPIPVEPLKKAYIHYADDKGQPMVAAVSFDDLKLMFDYLNSDANVLLNDYLALSDVHKKAVRVMVSSLLGAQK